MARALRVAMATRNVALSHSDALEIVARQLGSTNWNSLTAALKSRPLTSLRSKPLAGIPQGWTLRGRTDLFAHSLLPNGGRTGGPAISITSRARPDDERVPQVGEFLTVMQSINARPYHMQRLTFSAAIRTQDVTGYGRVWFRTRNVQGRPISGGNLGMADSPAGPVRGTTNWTRRHVTLDVTDDAETLNFGVMFGGGCGAYYASDFHFGPPRLHEDLEILPDAPVNLTMSVAPHREHSDKDATFEERSVSL
nr:glyoxalase superfamily protein [Acetobacter sacchari]